MATPQLKVSCKAKYYTKYNLFANIAYLDIIYCMEFKQPEKISVQGNKESTNRSEILRDAIFKVVQDVVKEKKLLRPNERIIIDFKIEKIPIIQTSEINYPEIVVSGTMESLESMDVKKLHLNGKSLNVLENIGIKTVAQLIQLSEDKILKHRNSGIGTVSDIRKALTEHGLTLLGSEPFTGKTFHDLAISSTIEKILRSRGINSIEDLMKYSEQDLRKSPDNPNESDIALVRYGVDIIVNRLRALGLALPNNSEK